VGDSGKDHRQADEDVLPESLLIGEIALPGSIGLASPEELAGPAEADDDRPSLSARPVQAGHSQSSTTIAAVATIKDTGIIKPKIPLCSLVRSPSVEGLSCFISPMFLALLPSSNFLRTTLLAGQQALA
jgi:hypothetical protein